MVDAAKADPGATPTANGGDQTSKVDKSMPKPIPKADPADGCGELFVCADETPNREWCWSCKALVVRIQGGFRLDDEDTARPSATWRV